MYKYDSSSFISQPRDLRGSFFDFSSIDKILK